MPRDLARTKPTDSESNGLDEFAGNGRERVTKDVDSPVQSGWSVERRVSVNRGDRPTQFKVPDEGEEILIAFLEDRPFASFFQHWVKTDKGRRGYVCLGKHCPLCARGDRPKSQDWFNVAEIVNSDLSNKGVDLPRLALWYCSADPAEKIKERADSKRTSPINKDGQYFAISKRTGKNGFNTYSVDPVKEDELREDWGVEPVGEQLRGVLTAKLYTADLVKPNTKPELQDIADEYFGD